MNLLTFLIYSDDEGSRKLLQRQKAAEEKASQERADAELARQLAAELEQPIAPGLPAYSHTSSQNGATSAYDRILGRTPSHTFGRPSSPNNSLSQSLHRNTTGLQVSGSDGFASRSHPRISAVASEDAPHFCIPGSFPHESASDSDSSIEMIPSGAFQDNGRYQPYPQLNNSRAGVAVQAGDGSYYSRSILNGSNIAMNPHQQYGGQQTGLQNPHGINLPRPAAMGMQQPSRYTMNHSSYQPPGGLGSGSVFGNGQTFGLDPLRDMIKRTQGIDWSTMTDGYGNPVDSRLNDLSDYINDPRKTQQEIQDLLENIRPDEEIPKENREGTPDGLKYPLYEHQKLALTWLKNMEEGTNKGGILADDMGLGKTISALALILSRPSTDRTRRVNYYSPLEPCTLLINYTDYIDCWSCRSGSTVGTRDSNKDKSKPSLEHVPLSLIQEGYMGCPTNF